MVALKIFFTEIKKEDEVIKKVRASIRDFLDLEEAENLREADIVVAQGIKLLKTDYSLEKTYLISESAWNNSFPNRFVKEKNIFLYTLENGLADFWEVVSLCKEKPG